MKFQLEELNANINKQHYLAAKADEYRESVRSQFGLIPGDQTGNGDQRPRVHYREM
jgi:hypothetical protein